MVAVMDEAFTRFLFEQAGSPIVIYEAVDGGADFLFVDVNPAAERVEGLTKADLIGRRVTEAFPAVKAFGLLDVFRRVWRTGESERHPLAFYADGRVTGWRENRVFRLESPRRLAVCYDNGTDLHGLLDSLSGFVGIYTPDGLLVDANKAALKAANLSRRDVIGQPFWETYWWSHSEEMQGRVRAALARAADGEIVRGEFEVRVGDADTVFIDASFGPLPGADGTVERLFSFGVDVTARKRAELDLMVTARRFAEAERIARIGSWELDHATGGLFWSDEVFRIFELDPARFKPSYDTFLDAVHPEDRDAVNVSYVTSLKERTPYTIAHRLLLPGGRIKWVSESCETDFDDAGKPLVSRGTVQDVTDLKRMEENLRENEVMLASLFDNVPLALLIKNADHVIERANRTYLSWQGRSLDEVAGRYAEEVEKFRDAADVATAYDHENEVFASGATTNRQVDRVLADGQVHTLSITKFPIHGRDGRIAKTGTVGIDLTELTRAHRAAEESEKRLRDIYDIAPAAIITVAADMSIQLFNKGAERIFGYRADEVLGESMNILMPERFHARHHHHVRDFGRSGEEYRMMDRRREIQGRRKNGSEFPAAASVSRLKVGDDDLFTVLLLDMSERNEAQKALLAAKTEAEAASRAKSDFLASMSHDLRTPLNAIIGFSEFISNQYFGPVNDKYREYAADILKSGGHLLALVDQILDLSMIESGRNNLVREDLDALDLIGECVKIVQGKAEAARVALKARVIGAGVRVHADRRAVRQVLINLLSNAVKFTPPGGRVDVFASRTESGTAFTVTDTGRGIAPDDLARILEPFSRGERDAYKATDGWGLGLPIVKGLVKAHDGTFSISSTVGSGTIVTVSFPAVRGLAAAARGESLTLHR